MKRIAGLFTEFLGESCGIQAIFIHHHSRAKVFLHVGGDLQRLLQRRGSVLAVISLR